MNVEKLVNVKLDLTPSEIADLFCDMDNNEQAEFFNKIGSNVQSWIHPFVFQLQTVVDTCSLTPEAKQVMFEIGEYSK